MQVKQCLKPLKEKRWIRIRNPGERIRGSGSVSKRHRSGKKAKWRELTFSLTLISVSLSAISSFQSCCMRWKLSPASVLKLLCATRSRLYGTRLRAQIMSQLASLNSCRSSEEFLHHALCCGSGMFIPDPSFPIPDPNPHLKILTIFNPKNCCQALGNMIRDVHPGSGSWFLPIPDPGVKKEPDPRSGSATLVIPIWHLLAPYNT